jgi:ankyrin repeat protein
MMLEANHIREVIPLLPLLHHCVTINITSIHTKQSHENISNRKFSEGKSNSADPVSESKYDDSIVDSKLEIAKYLLSIKNPAVNVRTFDEEGLSVLHLAAKRGDIRLFQLILAAKDESIERKSEIDINLRCSKQGFTPLHYAAQQGQST